MKLRFKPINFESGRPIAFINNALAEKLNIEEGDRIQLSCNGKKLLLPVNLVEKLLSEKELGLSDEAISSLNVRRGAIIEISVALEPRSTHYILKKYPDMK